MDLDPNLESKTSIDPTPLKRARSMKRVAEIVMVLSGMAQIRAGKEPTVVEKALVAEARERLTAIVEAEVKPKDLIDREAVRTLVDDLGLNKRDPLMGHRTNKLSISERVVVTKKKMEESRNFTSPTSIFAHSSMHGTPNYHTDRQNLMTYSPGGFQNISPGIHVQTIPSSRHAHVSETGASGLASNLSKDTQRCDGHSNMSPFTQQAQASADKSEASSASSNQASKKNETKLSEANKPTQASTNAQEQALIANHEDICKRVQKILQPKVFDHPNWNPPSAEYTNQPLQCQVCKININDTESLLVCDACEKGVHLKCLMNFGNKEGIPKAEWHCPRCLIASNGRPFPPKYGRVTRTIPPQKPTPSEKKPESVPVAAAKIDQQKPAAAASSSTIVALAAPCVKAAGSDNSPEQADKLKADNCDKEASPSNSTEQAEKQEKVISGDALEKQDEDCDKEGVFANSLIEQESDGACLKSSAQVENNICTNDNINEQASVVQSVQIGNPNRDADCGGSSSEAK